ncbi:amino acid ABC transporter permease [Ruegeria pomeroyi]|nr:amino acid ABC transporter permease [Ruegeria pomeroyi]
MTDMLRPPIVDSSPLKRLFQGMFGTPLNAAISLVILGFLIWLVPGFLRWAIIDAVWTSNDPELCRAPDAGACWAVIKARGRLIFFGVYPIEEQWRAILASIVMILTVILSCVPWFWTARRIITTWLVGFTTYVLLMRGGFAGLDYVGTSSWGGLALTLFIFAAVTIAGMPLAILLVLARRSELPVVRSLAAFAIDLTRSFPLLTILFAAAVILPLALPEWLSGDKLFRVIAAFAFFFGCYQSEILRGGYQSIDKGQSEAAAALGLSYWQREFLVLLPQVFSRALPPTINQFVITFKETSIVSIIGFFDIIASTNAAIGRGDWVPYFVEAYIFAGMIFFVFVFALSKYGGYLERRPSVVGQQR